MHQVFRRTAVLWSVVTVGAALLLATGLSGSVASAAPAPIAPAPATVVTADSLPTTQIDGAAWTQAIVGDTVYVGGNFSTARRAGAAPGVNTVPRANFLAYALSTGVLVPGFAPSFNGQVKTVVASADGSRLYVGGDFTSVNGQPRNRLAAFDLATGQLVANFAPSFNHVVNSLVVSGSTLYVGGDFTQVNGLWRIRLAAVAAVNGALLDWRPAADRTVLSMVLTSDGSKLIVGGSFQYLNTSVLARGLGAVDPTTGATLPWSSGIPSFGPSGGFTSLHTDGTSIVATSYNYGFPPGFGAHQFEGTASLNSATGSIVWMEDCHGDTYDSFSVADYVYEVGHAHYCQTVGGFPQLPGTEHQATLAFTKAATGTLNTNTEGGYRDWAGTPSPTMLGWFPYLQPGTFTGQDQAAWSITGTSQYLALAGEFPAVNANPQQGLTRFAIPAKAPKKQGPRLSGTSFQPSATAVGGVVRISVGANWDRDNTVLTYQLIRDGNPADPVDTATASSQYWSLPTVNLFDRSAAPNSAHSYTVQAVDPDGNSATSSPVVATAGAAMSPYAQGVIADGAQDYWRLDEPSGTAVYDVTARLDATANSAVSRNVAGAIAGDSDKATGFSAGSSQGLVRSNSSTTVAGSDAFSIEAWVKTTSAAGGVIVDLGNKATGNSTTAGRVLYMDRTGRLYFGVDTGTKTAVSSPKSYRDGAYHHIVGTLGATGLILYVDGALVATNASVTAGPSVTGYWRIGGDSLSGWPNRPSSTYLSSSIDEVAVYSSALTPPQVARHAIAGGLAATVPNAAPVAAFTTQQKYLAVTADGSASTDADGTISGYSWDFGDGSAAVTGAVAAHTYAAAGTYPVALTVTDNDGASTVLKKSVTVAPNVAPVAAFTATVSGLTTNVDGSASTDSDGTVAAYSWNWGDGSPAGSGSTSTHTYGASGTYQVILTATDDQGLTSTITHSVTVAAPQVPPVAVAAVTASGLAVNADGSTSTDQNGSIAGYQWDFGDGTTVVPGATAQHTYQAAGTYSVTLTVTDDQGLTGTDVESVSVAPVAIALDTDAFGRTVASGWAAADTGGPWTLSGTQSRFSVDGSVGVLNLATPGASLAARLVTQSATNAIITSDVALDKALTGAALYVGEDLRSTGTSSYRLKARIAPDGSVQLITSAIINKAEKSVGSVVVPGLTYTQGDVLRMQFSVNSVGASSTLAGKIWKVGATVPTQWQLSGTDATASLQAAGGVGVWSYLGSAATNAPLRVLIDNLSATTTDQ